MLDGKHAGGGATPDDSIYVAANMHWDDHSFELPKLPDGQAWHVFANTGMPSPQDCWAPGSEPVLGEQSWIMVGSRSIVILVGR